jgi:hypothetical protein
MPRSSLRGFLLAFGGILPLVSLMFARILANTAGNGTQANPELAKAKQTIKMLRSELDAAEVRMPETEARANAAEERFAAAGGSFARLFAEESGPVILLSCE